MVLQYEKSSRGMIIFPRHSKWKAKLTLPLTVIQATSQYFALVQEFFEELINQDAPVARFMKTITSKCWAYSKEAMKNKRDVYFGPGFVSYDAYAMAACIDGSTVLESIECPVRVELQGSMSRGMLVLDRTKSLEKSHAVSVLSKCDVAKFGQLLMESLRQPRRKWGLVGTKKSASTFSKVFTQWPTLETKQERFYS